MNELFLYDRDEGLFRVILDKSKVIGGRYHVCPNYGHELNTANIDSYIADPKFGLTTPAQKYPIAVCLTPKSRFIKTQGGALLEQFTFSIFFLCQAFQTGANQVKDRNKDTNTSAHHIWYDWKDMKDAAVDFMGVLKLMLNKQITISSVQVPLKTIIQMNGEDAVYNRHSKFQIDRLVGVSVSFILYLDASGCVIVDYEQEDIDAIVLPSPNIHPIHPM